MRWLSMLALLCFVAPAYGQENEAEKLFRAMDKKVRSAKSLQLVSEAEATGDGKKLTFKATAYLAVGNKFHLEIEGDFFKMEKLLFISDGKTTYSKQKDKVETKNEPPEKITYDQAAAVIARVGMAGAFIFIGEARSSTDPPKKEAFDVDKKLPAKNFKLGAKEKIGQRDAQVIDYVVEANGKPLKVSLAMDVERQVPLKIVVTGDEGGKTFRMVENFSVFTVNGKIDPKVFEVPK